MKSFSIFLLLLVALISVLAVPNLHGSGLTVCGDDNGCLNNINGRALMGSSSVNNGLASSSDKIVTETIDTYTTVPCSTELSGITASTATISKHATSTDLITMTITSSRASISSSDSIPTIGTSSSIALTLTLGFLSNTASISSTAPSSSSSIFNIGNASSIPSATTASTLSPTSSLASATSVSSTFSLGGLTSSSTSTMAYVPSSYGPESTIGLKTFSETAIFGSTSSVDALSATHISSQPTYATIVTQPTFSAPPLSVSFEKITSSSTSTRTTTVIVELNPSYTTPNYAGAWSSAQASMSLISSLHQQHTAVVATTNSEACSAFSTLFITVTGTLPSTTSVSSGAAPANPLYSQSQLHTSSTASSSGTASIIGGYQASTEALSAIASHSTGAGTTITSSLTVMPTPAASTSISRSTAQPSNVTTSAPSISAFVGPNTTSSSTAPTSRVHKHVNAALVLCVIGALVMFAV